MLGDKKLKAFVPTTDADKARRFYEDTLGLTLLSQDDYALEFDANGTLLRVTFVRELVPQGFTILGWNVPDIYEMIRSLNEKGIECNQYDFLKQDNDGVWISPGGSKVAWFNDPDGNVLSLTELD
jgi:catechol 2,3-dioxygenase-like lactoylglutathione lyase family enzyme